MFHLWKSTFPFVWFIKHLRSTSEPLGLPSVVLGIAITKQRLFQLQKVCFSTVQAPQAACAALVGEIRMLLLVNTGKGGETPVRVVRDMVG